MPKDGPGTAPPARHNYDPLVLNARRELLLTLLVWVAFAVWVIGVSWWLGREPVADPEAIATVLGMPGWVFWGVALPWLAANAFTFWFCFGFMAEDSLDEAVEEDAWRDAPDAEKELPS